MLIPWGLHCNGNSTYIFLFLEIAGPQPQFPHSCVCERFIYSQDRSTYFLLQKRQTHRSQTHECGNWDWGPDIPFLGIFVSNFRHRSLQCKKGLIHGIIKLFRVRLSLISDIPPGDGKIDNLFLQCSGWHICGRCLPDSFHVTLIEACRFLI